jgi:predicted membrane protein
MNWSKILENVASVKIKSITDSLFKFSLFFVFFGILASALKVDSWILVFLFSISGILILFGIIFYCYFSFKNPDYLRSEHYQLKKRTIEILGDKENQENRNIKELKYISSPYGLDSGNKNQLVENVE